jgi:HPt (histidine-containing phosphotransfer) domain-containing protein
MAALRTAFTARAGEEHDRLAAAVRDGDRETMRVVAHRLAGAGGLFGFPQISAVAGALDHAIESGAGAAEVAQLSFPLLGLLSGAAAAD